MLTLYHAPKSRSTRLIRLLDELGALDRVQIEIVSIPRQDGSGKTDPANPHPEGKVPLLVHDGVQIRETNAIIQYLTELYPKAGLGREVGDPMRGAYLSWLAYYGNVVEPVLMHSAAGLSHPALTATFRGPKEMGDRLEEALADKPYLLGDTYSAADLLLTSPFVWFPAATPDRPVIHDWIKRTNDRPSVARTADFDAKKMQAA